MNLFEAQVCTPAAIFLGECCRWDEEHQELLWVNQMPGPGQLYRATVAGPEVSIVRQYDFNGSPSAFTPIEGKDAGWIVAIDRSLWHVERDGARVEVASAYAQDDTTIHFNDGAADPRGRFWIGSMANDAAVGRAALFRFDATEGLRTVFEGITISNGIAWSPTGDTMYHVDSGPGTIRAFRFDEDGEVSDMHPFVQFDVAREGTPDGICIDEEGGVWVAVWGGYEVRHYAPNGQLVGRVHVDTAQPSSCALGGAVGTTLYITTAQEDLSAAQLAAEPLAGRLFCVDVGVRGIPLQTFEMHDITHGSAS